MEDKVLALIKELRERTGAGILECRKALLENDLDIEKAIVVMRKAGAAKADAKKHRVAKHGLITVSIKHNTAVIVEVNCETDFAASSEPVLNFCNQFMSWLHIEGSAAYQCKEHGEAVAQVIADIGENFVVKHGHRISGSCLGAYAHNRTAGCIVSLSNSHDHALAADIAAQITALNPLAISDIPDDILAKEMLIWQDMAEKLNKPEAIQQQFIKGHKQKLAEQYCLLEQPFFRDPSMKVKDVLQQAKVEHFIRLELGQEP